LIWVGIGCGGLLLLATIGSVLAYYMAKQAAETGLAALSAAAASAAAPPAPGDAPADGATDSSGAPIGGACAKAAECCRKIIQKSNAGAQAEAGCLALKQLPEASCVQPLQTYKQSAKLLSVNCD
jgi:hypothetical protein